MDTRSLIECLNSRYGNTVYWVRQADTKEHPIIFDENRPLPLKPGVYFISFVVVNTG